MDWKMVLKILIANFKSMDTLKETVNREDELMRHLWNIEGIRELTDVWLECHYNERESKSVAKAQTFKASGNKEFQAKNYAKSIELYTQCALHAPANSSELPIALANRSASLFYLNRYDEATLQVIRREISFSSFSVPFIWIPFDDEKDCIKDIELAVKLNYPERLRYKLYLRAAQCYSKLGKEQLAEETISKVLELLDNADYISSSAKDNVRNKVNELTFAKAANAENASQDNLSKAMSRIVFEENATFPRASVAVDVKYKEEVGRHVVANRFIKKGDVLFVEKPLSFTLLNRDTSNDLCQHCKRSITDVPVPCVTCLNTVYCNETCLSEAWRSYHRWECPGNEMGVWKEIGLGYLALKVLLTCSTTADAVMFNEMQNLVTNFDKMYIKDLAAFGITAIMLTIYLSRYTNYFETNDLEDCLISKFLDPSFNSNFDVSTDYDKELYVSSLLLRYIIQLIGNGFAITKSDALSNRADCRSAYEEHDVVATGIYLAASMMNHSCDHNTISIYVDDYLIVKASRDIGEGEEVFNCYGPHYRYTSIEKRREILESNYCFTCKCKPCTTPKLQYFLERFSGLKCTKCNGALCNIKDSMRCSDCDATCESPPSSVADEIARATELFEAAEAAVCSRKTEEALDKLKKCLRIQKAILYKHNDSITESLNLMGDIYKIMGRWLDSVKWNESALSAYKEKFGPSDLTLLNHVNNFVDVCFTYLENESNTATDTYKNVLRKTEKYLSEVEELTDLHYGSWSNVYEDVKAKRGKIELLCEEFR